MFPDFLFLSCVLLAWTGTASAALRKYNFTIHAGSNAPDGYTRQVYLINGQQPAPLIDINEGDDLEVYVQNDLPVASTIHWPWLTTAWHTSDGWCSRCHAISYSAWFKLYLQVQHGI